MAQKINLRALLILALFLLTPMAAAAQQIITVDDDGPADYDNIQAAIGAAVNGDTVEVKPGIYTGPGNRDIDFLSKAITVRSTDPNDPDIVAATIIDCNGTELDPHRGFKFISGEDTNSVLRGLTIAYGFGPEETGYDVPPWVPFSVGGAIFCDQSSPTISDCVITGNAAGTGLTALDVCGAGGGLACRAASPIIVRCRFTDNFARYGGAIFGGHEDIDANKATPEISNCSITNNSSYCGAGICGCDGNIIDCTISDNNSYFGGGLYGCDGHIDECNISDNHAEHRGGGLYECGGLISNSNIVGNFVPASPSVGGGGGICCIEAVPTITDCNISYNSAAAGGGIYGCAGPITRCIITGNTGHYGGGIDFCEGPITECTVTWNEATGYGGGLLQCLSDISNCNISFNTAQREGGGLARCYGSIDNCTITGNAVLEVGNKYPISGSWGGGLLLCYGDITNCTITHNWAGGSGGGLAACFGSISNCLITANSAMYDGGALWECQRISNCIITGNRAPRGGALFSQEGRPNITGCTIAGNQAAEGGAVLCYNRSEATIDDCILWNNAAPEGPQVALKAAFIPPLPLPVGAPTVFVSYSDIEGGQDAIHLDPYSTLIWESGNIDADPCFLLPGYWEPNGTPPDANDDFWMDGDYHLLPGSPCIDTGDPNYVAEPNETDLDGNTRIVDGDSDGNSVIDMGAYEANYVHVQMKFTPQALNSGSQGRWFKLHFVLPEGFVAQDVDMNKPALCRLMDTADVIKSVDMNVFVNEEDLVEIEAFFGRGALSLCRNGQAERNITILGLLAGTGGQDFYGTDTIKIINKTWEHLAGLTLHWLEEGCGGPDWCSGQDLNQDGTVDFVDLALFGGCCIEILAE